MQTDLLSLQSKSKQEKAAETIQTINDRFQIKNILLGSGELGNMHVCWDKEDMQVVAAKVISKENFLSYVSKYSTRTMNKQFFIKSLQNQAIRMNVLNHDNILKLYGYAQTDKVLFYFFKYCNQGTLYNLIQKGSLVLKENSISMMRQIIRVCQYLHKKRICHRDIRPQNILVHNGIIKLSHFSSSVCLDDVNQTDTMNLLAESSQFMAPELHNRSAYTLKSDIWSIGVTIFYIVYGRSPWPHVKNKNHWYKRLLTSIKPPQTKKSPEWLYLIVQRMLIYEHELRPSIQQVSALFSKY